MSKHPRGRRPVTERERQLYSMPAIQSQMPVTFKVGNEFSEISGYCAHCELLIPDMELKGIVKRPIESVAVIEAVGYCDPCKMLTRIDFRLHDDMRVSGIKDGKWVTWRHSPTLFDSLRNLIVNLFK